MKNVSKKIVMEKNMLLEFLEEWEFPHADRNPLELLLLW